MENPDEMYVSCYYGSSLINKLVRIHLDPNLKPLYKSTGHLEADGKIMKVIRESNMSGEIRLHISEKSSVYLNKDEYEVLPIEKLTKEDIYNQISFD